MALNIEQIIADIKEATVLELNDLVKAIEDLKLVVWTAYYMVLVFV